MDGRCCGSYEASEPNTHRIPVAFALDLQEWLRSMRRARLVERSLRKRDGVWTKLMLRKQKGCLRDG